MKKALLQVLVMLKFRLKWQSNQAPKFLRGSVLGEMMDSPIVTTLKVKIFVQWPFGDQLFGFSRQGKFLGAKLY